MRLPFIGSFLLSQEFGVNPDNYKKFLVLYPDNVRRPMKGHNGLDFALPLRTKLFTPHSGIVKEVLFDKDGYGWYVKIENDEEGSVIAHMDRVYVKIGYQLQEGDSIGLSGNTGNSTGPHVHWGYYRFPRNRSNGLAGFIDQTPFLLKAGIKLSFGKPPLIIDGEVVTPAVGGATNPSGANMYNGQDLNNPEAMKICVDMWRAVMVENKYIPIEQYNNDIANATTKQEIEDSNYTELKARGYTTVADVTKAIENEGSVCKGAKKQLVDVLKDNERVHLMLAEKEKQDYTVIEAGMKAEVENKELKTTVAEATVAAGAGKPEKLVTKVNILKNFVDRVIIAREGNSGKEADSNVEPVKIDASINWLMKIFKLIPSEKEVK